MSDAELRSAIRSMTNYRTFEYFRINEGSPNDGSPYIIETIGPFGTMIDRKTVFVKTVCQMEREIW